MTPWELSCPSCGTRIASTEKKPKAGDFALVEDFSFSEGQEHNPGELMLCGNCGCKYGAVLDALVWHLPEEKKL